MGGATPLRSMPLPERDGCRLLSESTVGHLDGGEAEVRHIVERANDLSSLSDELARYDCTWETRYHFSRERGNILRALDLPADARVLEIGAGCGAMTRYLGERCAVVDALEPNSDRAPIARLRTRDLDGVEVFIGDLDAVPRQRAYDAIVIVGVLEYVGGQATADERVRMLQETAARLGAGGRVICAIENRIGVRYLAGAAEDHYGRPFVGLEEYPIEGPARTFARTELEAIFTKAGLIPRVYGVMPDYKFARLVFTDELLRSRAQGAAWRVPSFPSDGAPHEQPRLADEFRLWRGLVRAGLGMEVVNSFLVVASTSGGESLWPENRLGVWFSSNRRAGMAAQTRIVEHASGVRLERLALGASVGRHSGLRQVNHDRAWMELPPLLEVLEDAPLEAFPTWLDRWRRLVMADGASGARNIDLVPHNLLVRGTQLIPVDEEWFDDRYDAEAVLGRGVVHTALSLVERRAPERWPVACATVRDVVAVLAEAAGAPWVTACLNDVVRRESELLVEISREPRGAQGWNAAVEEQVRHFEVSLDRPLDLTALGNREMDLRQSEATDRSRFEQEITDRESRLAAAEAQLASLTEQLSREMAGRAAVERSRSWRLTAPARRAAGQLRRARER